MKYTLDTNCVIDLEEKRDDHLHLEQMIKDDRNGKIEISVVAISASENQKGGLPSATFEEFEKKLTSAGLTGIKMIYPMHYWDITYWDQSIWDGDQKLEQEIHDILFSGTPIESPDKVGFPEKKWRNNKCDVQIAWAHIFNNHDILVTRDNNFHKNKAQLKEVGVGEIIYPNEYQP